MKKNFFKQLAGVLSLAMVVTAVAPMGTAQAATQKTFKLNKNSLTVYLQHDVYSNQFNLEVASLADNALTWTSSNTSVATVSKWGNVVGKKVGTANITLKKAGYTTKVVKVTVKDLAKSVDITNAPTDNKIKIGDKFDFDATVVGKAGGASSQATVWTVSDPTMATVTKDGVVTALKAGTFDVVATAGEATDKVSVTVPVTLTNVKLVATNKVELTFDSSVKGIGVNDIVITNTESKLRLPVKAVTLSADEKVVTAEVYASFADTKKYTVTAKDTTLDLTAAVGKIASIELLDQVVLPNSNSTIKYRVLDANGLDITANYTLGTNLFVDTTNNFITSAGVINLAKDGDIAKVTLRYVSYDATTGALNEIKSAEATVTAGTPSISGVKSWVINSSASTADFTNDKQVITADQTAGKYLHIKGTKGTADVTTGFTFTSLDESVLVVDKATGQLFPIKAGAALVKVENGTFVDYVNVTVGASRAAATLASDLTSTISLSNSLSTPDSYVVTFTLKDQYGEAIPYTGTPSVVAYDNTTPNFVVANGVGTVADGKYVVTFTAVNGKTGSTSFKVTVGDKVVMVPVSVVTPGTATGYAANLTKTTVDTFKGDATNLTVYVMSGATKRDIVSDATYKYEVKDSANKTVVAATTYVAGVQIPTATLADGVYTVSVKNGTALVATTTFTVKSTKPAATLETTKISVKGTSTILAAIEEAFDVKVAGLTGAQAITGATFISLDTTQIAATATDASSAVVAADTAIYVQTVTIAGYTVNVNKVITITK